MFKAEKESTFPAEISLPAVGGYLLQGVVFSGAYLLFTRSCCKTSQ